VRGKGESLKSTIEPFPRPFTHSEIWQKKGMEGTGKCDYQLHRVLFLPKRERDKKGEGEGRKKREIAEEKRIDLIVVD